MRLSAEYVRGVSCIALMALGCGYTSSAMAQDASAGTPAEQQDTAPADEPIGGEIVVTGSRIGGEGFVAPTPVTSITAETLTTAAPTTISAGLMQLPQFRSSTRPEAANSTATGAAGANQLNLRNLGVNRNLVLLDGRRVVPGSANYVVDINTLPEALVRRVDVVTGGASAAYGSDAVAGVVNFILDDRFTGLRGTVQAGVSAVGDAPSKKANLTFGTPFANGRGHIVLTGEIYDSTGIGINEVSGRPWAQRSPAVIPNVPTSASPSRLLINDNVYLSSATGGGLISTGPLAGTQFLPGGVSAPFTFGTQRGTIFMVGGDANALKTRTNLTNNLNRYSTFGRVNYEFSDAFKLLIEGAYARSETTWEPYYNPNYASAGNAFTIYSDNPYLPADIRARMSTAGITSFSLGRVFVDAPSIGALNRQTVWHGTIAAKGDISPTWSYDAYYQHGESRAFVLNTGTENYNRSFAAVDAVRDPASGNIVCRSTLLFGRDPNCVPINLFGEGSPSAAALKYITGDQWRRQKVTQDVAAFNVRGELFSLWAAQPVAIATGAEYREESGSQVVNAESLDAVSVANVRGVPAAIAARPSGPFVVGNPKPNAGSYNVKEAYFEANIPIIANAPLLNLFELNGAIRVTDYSLSGTVVTWKVGGNYKPFEDLRIRATRSRDIRAPNISELYSGAIQSTGTVRDPSGATVSYLSQTVGNPDLLPEKADSLTVGAVYQPSFLPRFNVSLDYYDIKIEGGIAALTAQLTIDECARGSAVACANLTLLPGQYVIRQPNLNLAGIQATGLDFEMAYTAPLAGGSLNLHASANYQWNLIFQSPGSVPLNRAGQVGDLANPGSPKWIASASATYTNNGLTVFLQGRFLGAAKYMNTYVEGIDIDDNSVPSVFYLDTSLRYKIPDERASMELFVTVNNVLNKAPPVVPFIVGGTVLNTNDYVYDVIGRYFTAGVTVKF